MMAHVVTSLNCIWRCLVKFSAKTPTVLTDFSWFPQFFQAHRIALLNQAMNAFFYIL
jgi:hypothetical protein